MALQLPRWSLRAAHRCGATENYGGIAEDPGIQGVIAVTNFSLLTQVQSTNAGFFFVALKPWDVRKSKQEQLEYIQ